MSEQNTLDKILENTEVVKEVVVTRENEKQKAKDDKADKRKDQLKKAQEKFVQIKASVKPELKEKIIARAQDGNVNAYLLKLVENDLNQTPSLFDDAQEEQNNLGDQALKDENEKLKIELKKYEDMSFTQKLKWLFS